MPNTFAEFGNKTGRAWMPGLFEFVSVFPVQSLRVCQAVKTRAGLGGGDFDDQFAVLDGGLRAGVLPGAGHFLRVLHHPAGLVCGPTQRSL